MSQKRTIEITENDSNKKQKKTTYIQNALSAPNFQVKRTSILLQLTDSNFVILGNFFFILLSK